MPVSSKRLVAHLEALAQARFSKLSPAEIAVISKSLAGEKALCVPFSNHIDINKEPDSLENPRYGLSWSGDRVVRGEVLEWLCTSDEARALVHSKGIQLWGARISGGLDLSHREITFPLALVACRFDQLLNLDNTRLPTLDLNRSWAVEISLSGANIGGDLIFDNSVSGSIRALDISVGGSISLLLCRITGWAGFDRANVRGDFRCLGSQFNTTWSTDHGVTDHYITLSLASAVVDKNIVLASLPGGPDFPLKSDGVIMLSGASCRIFQDGYFENDRSSWTKVYLSGFKYNQIVPARAEDRIEWLEHDTSHSNQPYLHLADTLESNGDAKGAVLVRTAMEAKLTPWWQWPLKAPIGYGYRPENALWELIGLAALGTVLYRRARRTGRMIPTDREAYERLKAGAELPAHYPDFEPLVFSLENTFPLVKLGQRDKWQPDTGTTVPKNEGNLLRRLLAFIESPTFLRWFVWLQVLIGWVLATLFLAAVSGLVHHSR